MSKKIYNWDAIQDYLVENTQAGLQMAVLEADKILMNVIEDLGYPGKTNRHKIKIAKKLFSDYGRLQEAHGQAAKIKRVANYSLSPKLTEEILAVYYQALLDIKTHKNPRFDLFSKIKLFWRKKIPKIKKSLKWIGVYIFAFFLLVLFLDRTQTGNTIVQTILRVTNFIFSWFLILILLGIGAVATLIGSYWYLRGRRKIDIDISQDEQAK